MFDMFCDYMYYLLTSPFKKVSKTINQWYILFKILGKRFDDAMESLYNAREQTMLATCDPEMLPVHAEDRKMTQYPGEKNENFRKRIANYQEVLRLGGSDAGVLLAVKTLGYSSPELIKANILKGCTDRWAEFYIVITCNVALSLPVSLDILKKEVRKTKYVGAKDNYLFQYYACIPRKNHTISCRAGYMWTIAFWKNHNQNSTRNSICMDYHMHISHERKIAKIEWHAWHNLLYLDGTWKLDGSKKLDGYENMEVLTMEYVTTKLRREKMSEASHMGRIAKAKWIALGTGGVNAKNEIIAPSELSTELVNEVIRKEYAACEKKSDISYAYTIELKENELSGEYISEMALIDEDGDIMIISHFLPKGKDEEETTFTIEDEY